MIVKGIIKSIDVQGNTCVVRMPSFETAGNDEIVATATVSNSPGSYNGYKVDDVVWVAFENDQLECPVIIGKLYLGIEAERADPRGTLNVVDSKISRTAEIPFDTKLGRNLEPGMPKTLAPFNSLNSIASNLSAAEVNIAQNDRDYGNRFRQTFEAIDGNKTLIDQTNEYIKNEVQSYDGDAFGWRLDTGKKDSEDNYIRKPSWRVYAKGTSAYLAGAEIWLTYRDNKYFYVLKYNGESDTSVEANITISDGNYFLDGIDTDIEYIENEVNLHKITVDKNKVLAVKLDDSENKYYWYINNIKTNLEVHETIDILTANEDGLNITGTVTATEGKIGNFNIEPREGGWGGLYTDGYATEFKEASKLSENNETGVYIGPDGLMIGKNFSIDAYGNIKSSQLDIMSKRVNAITSSSFDDGISIPLTFQRVEGLKSKKINGKKSGYINTGHTLNDTETLEIKFLINDEDTVDATSIEDNFVFGCLNNAAGLALKVGKFEEGNNIAIITGTTSQFYSISTGTKHRIRITNNQPVEIDGKAVGEAITYSSVAVTEEVVAPLSVESRIVPVIRPVYVFEQNDDWSGGGSIVGETYESGNILLFGAKDNDTIKNSESITIYSFKIYNNTNTLIDYFIPATRNDDVKTGMYNVKSGSEEDVKNGTFSECQLDSGSYCELVILQNTVIYESNFSVLNDKISSEISETTKYINEKYEENKTLIDQTAKDINAIVSTKLSSLNSGGEEKELENGLTTKGLGWSLDNEKWAVKAYDQNTEGTLPEDGLDLFTISRDTIEINAPNIRLSGYPSSTITSYTSTNSPTEITDENKDDYTWSEDMPEWENGKYIWQRTVIKKWEYQKVEKDSVDENGEPTKIYVEEWVDTKLSDKIVCLAGTSAASYWLNCASNFHFGIRHIDILHVSAMRKVGTGAEELDSDAILYWWNPSSSESNKWVKAININYLDFTANNFRQLVKDNDLKILSTHDSTFTPDESTTSGTAGVCSFVTIKYSPLSSPILEISPESSTIQYSSDGTIKLGTSVSSTAKLYLNGEILSYDPRDTAKTSPRVTYTWDVSDCEYTLSEEYVPNDTITIKSLSADTIMATCTATVQAAYNNVEGLFEGATYQKVFTVSKVFQGISIVSQTAYYALVSPAFGKDQPNLAKPTSDLIIRAEGYPNDPLYQIGDSSSSLTEKWSIYPPAHTSTTIEAGWKYWTSIKTIFSGNEEDAEFSTPIISEDLSGVYALAQGKTTNYYGTEDPNNGINNLKEGDCWFKTISSGADDYNSETGGDQGKLYQWNGAEWEDIGGELVANKLTANYIDALKITAKKITVLGSDNSSILFQADGNNSTAVEDRVQIAGFKVHQNTLTTGESDNTKIVLSGDGTANSTDERLIIGNNFTVLADGTVYAKNLYVGNNTTTADTQLNDLGDHIEEINENIGKIEANYVKTSTLETNYLTADDITSNYVKTSALDAVYAEIEKIDTNSLTVEDANNNIIFKADGNEGVDDKDRVQVGGFIVTNSEIASANNHFALNSNPKTTTATYTVETPTSETTTFYSFNKQVGTFSGITSSGSISGPCYKSSNQGVNSTCSAARLKFTKNLDKYTLYIRSSAEATWDYMIASRLYKSSEGIIEPVLDLSDSSSVAGHTKNNNSTSTSNTLDQYIAINYYNISSGDYINIVFRKDFSNNSNEDSGWFIAPTTIKEHTLNTDNFKITSAGKIIATGGNVGDWDINNGLLSAKVSTNNAGAILGINNVQGEQTVFKSDDSSSIEIINEDRAVLATGTWGEQNDEFTIGAALHGDQIWSNGIKSNSISTERMIVGNKFQCGSTQINNSSPYIYTTGIKSNYVYDERGVPCTSDNRIEINYEPPVDSMWKYELTKDSGEIIRVTYYESKNGGTTWTKTNRTTEANVRVSYKTKEAVWIGGGTYDDIIKISAGSSSGTLDTDAFWGIKDYWFTQNGSKSMSGALVGGSKASSFGINGNILPIGSSAKTSWSLGSSSALWKEIYAETGAVSTSDANQKNSITQLSDDPKYSILFDNLKPVKYRFNDGESGRFHTGLLAQEVKDAIEAAELTTKDFAAYIAADGGDGEVVGLRYSEFIALNIHEIQKLKKQISKQEEIIKSLEERLNNLENK